MPTVAAFAGDGDADRCANAASGSSVRLRISMTGGMGRTHLRGHTSILKRLVIHSGGLNLGLVMRHLIGIAQDRGLRLLESTDMSENSEMRELARDLGFHCRVDPEDAHQVIYGLPLPGPSRVS